MWSGLIWLTVWILLLVFLNTGVNVSLQTALSAQQQTRLVYGLSFQLHVSARHYYPQ
jgi:hypothetical protein